MPVLAQREVARPAGVGSSPGASPLAFCAGLLRPRVFVSEGALARLGARALTAVVAHEGHHAARRDPLRILIARAIGDAYSLRALRGASRRWPSSPPTPPPCAAAARRRSPRRCWPSTPRDRARARRPARGRGAARRGAARARGRRGLVIVALVVSPGRASLVPGHPRFCLPLASAPGWIAVRGHRAGRGDGARLARLAPGGRVPASATLSGSRSRARCVALLADLAVGGDLRCAAVAREPRDRHGVGASRRTTPRACRGR